MAQSAMQVMSREEYPLVHVGTPDESIEDMFNSIARRAFQIFESNGHLLGRDLSDWAQAERELFHAAHVDVSESDTSFSVRVEVPGFDSKELEVNLEGRCLTIAGKREKREERKGRKTIYSETCSDQLLRTITLPAEVNAAGVQAILKKGILEIEVPKAALAKKVAIAAEK